ncbi:uncharacterized protein LOC134178804 [Corticium candelabrum]|uniref:uncharacterized protein LOC134178804 n=1 Tax=Corticium candelabrum TaxID=121492 RepID=UPI002E276005|nr:uncharacterized protein LOC134178804 [Corticium candelabrum]
MEAAVKVCSRLRKELSESQTNRIAREHQIECERERHEQDMVKLQGLLRETETRVNELELFPRLDGTWTYTDPRTTINSGFWGYERSSLSLSLNITQAQKQKKNETISFTVTAKSNHSGVHRSTEQAESCEFSVRPAYILPLIKDKSPGRDAHVNSQYTWQTWYERMGSACSGANIPSYLVYDVIDDRIFSPWPSTYSTRELLEWTKSPLDVST